MKLSSIGVLLGTFTVGTEPHNLPADTSGNMWVGMFGTVATPGNEIWKLDINGNVLAKFTVENNPGGIAIDDQGNGWVANYYSNTVTLWKLAVYPANGYHVVTGAVWP